MKAYIFLFNGQPVAVHAKSLNDARHIINSWKQPGDKIIPMGTGDGLSQKIILNLKTKKS